MTKQIERFKSAGMTEARPKQIGNQSPMTVNELSAKQKLPQKKQFLAKR